MLKRISVAFLTVFLCVTPAMAMTADEFLSHKAENRDIAMFVLGNAEAGGVPELLRQAKEILGVAKTTPDAAMAANAKRVAFMHCAFASHLIRGLPKEEQSQHGNVLISILAQTAEVLNMNQDEMLKTLRGVSGIFDGILNGGDEGEQQNTPAKTNTGGGMLEQLKGSYLPSFPASEGYQTVGDSFEAFFEDPRWTLHDQLLTNVRLDGYTVVVKGIAYFNEKKVIFEVFLFWAYQEKGKKNLMFMGQDISVNGIHMSSPEEKDFMATVMLDSKR